MTLALLRRPVFLLAALAAVAARGEVTETFEHSYPLTTDGAIRLENVNGDIDITAWDKAEVSLQAITRAKTDEDLKKVHLKIDPSPDRLLIKADYEKKSGWFGGSVDASVHFKLMVPAGARLEKIESVNSDMNISGVAGTTNLATVNGRIHATGLASDARLESVNGHLSAAFASFDRVQEIKIESVNGGIDVTLPKGAGANLRTSTVNGGVTVEPPIKLGNSSRHNLAGQIGTGGPSLSIETVNGGIAVREK